MARTVKEIYNTLVEEKDKRLELKEIDSKSKMSVLNGILWIVAAGIRTLESLIDVATIDIGGILSRRVNGTPVYYAQALLKYQHGDDLVIRDGGLGFGYENEDESKRIITKVAYTEIDSDTNRDNRILYKVATGNTGELRPITPEELDSVKAYLNKIKFAGVNVDVTSKKGDILLPRLTVYHDGQLEESEMLDKITQSLKEYIYGLEFNASIKKMDVIDAVRHTKHVKDVYIDTKTEPKGGVFIVKYNDDGEIVEPTEVDRIEDLPSGYLTESTRTGDEVEVPTFAECITLKIE